MNLDVVFQHVVVWLNLRGWADNASCCEIDAPLFVMAFHYKVLSSLTILLGTMLCDTRLHINPL